MSTHVRIWLSILLYGALLTPIFAQTEKQSADKSDSLPSIAPKVESIDDTIDRVIAREHEELAVINTYHPIVETYVQRLNQKRNGEPLLSMDYYYLGQATLSGSKPPSYRSMLTSSDQYPKSGLANGDFNPFGFIQMIYVDRKGLDKRHYSFQYVGREFLGDVRCLVFDVKPLPKAGPGRFYGRIWAEDKVYTIVRFNGVYLPVYHNHAVNSHFDSWRMNVQPDLWLPAYAFAEETDLKIRKLEIKYINDLDRLRFRAQTRFWGYNLKDPNQEQEFSKLAVESPTGVTDNAFNDQEHDQSPVQATRNWQSQADNNVINTLVREGLVAPAGEVDKALDTVVNNLVATNNLDIEPPVHCRVLLTSTFDLFAVGHVIVISRGQLDVLPDEATLATMLAQGLAEIIVAKTSVDRFAFYDIVQLSPLEGLRRFSFRVNPREREESNRKAIAILQNSPYKNNLATAGLFLKEYEQDSKKLRALVAPHLGDRIHVASELTNAAPTLQPGKLDQVVALPMGTRIKLDPWTDKIELVKAKPTSLASARENMPLELTPLQPYLTRYAKQKSTGGPPKVVLNGAASSSPPEP
ncbi:MAG: hypothetical protein ACRD5M_05085 [Candidatus Acidiferrales bacterium]